MFIVTKEIDSENISRVCRTCLREDGEKMVCLFSGPARSSLAAKLRTLSCLEVWQGDGLPEKLCDRCVTRAESALLFREQCRAADLALRQAALKVSRAALQTASISRVHPQKHDFAPADNFHKFVKCTGCEAAFSSYHELYIHAREHLPFVRDNEPVRHMNIVESQHSTSYAENRVDKASDVLENLGTWRILESNGKDDRASCALHCSLCNHTFTNRMQLMNHHLPTHSHDVMVQGQENCDDENSIATENSEILTNRDYSTSIGHHTVNIIENLSYPQAEETTIEAINYSAHMGLETPNIVSNEESRQNVNSQNQISSDVSSECCNDIPRFSSFDENGIHGDVNDMYENPLVNEVSQSTKKIHKCSVCEKTFAQRSKLLSHSLSHTGEKPFACLICDKAYMSKSKLNAHNRLHTQTNVHRCNVCDKSFPYPSYLVEHSKIHENAKSRSTAREYECTICHKQFRLLKNLKVHLKLHTGKGLVRCEICHKAFSQKYNLKVHLRSHGIVGKILKCGHCGKTFAARGNYVEHLRIHTRIKPFKCRICGKAFSQSSHLKTHELSHTSSRPHQCRLCGKRYKLAAHLRRHASAHASVKSHKCEQCNQMFSQAFSLKRHMKRHTESQI